MQADEPPRRETLLEHMLRRCPVSMRQIEFKAAHGSTVESEYAIRVLELLSSDTRRRAWDRPFPLDPPP